MKYLALDMMKFKRILLTFIVLLTQLAVSQEKSEREFSIGLRDFPDAAQRIIREQIFIKRIKFYKEIDGINASYEAKFKFKKHLYSLEFSEDGSIEDIEIKIKKNEIPKNTLQNISSYLKTNSDAFKLKKIQAQYLNSKFSDIITKALNFEEKEAINYEIIVELKLDHKINLYEFTFDSVGNYLNKRKVSPSSYEHVLY